MHPGGRHELYDDTGQRHRFALSLAGLGFGIASAWYWWQSSREAIVLPDPPSTVTYTGPVITAGPLADYMRRVSALNAKAAIYGAIGVTLATTSSVVGNLC
jgi:hypothetical protein